MLTGILKVCYCCGRGVWSFRGGLVGGDGQLTSGHAAERATWLVWVVVAGTDRELT